MTTIDIFVLKTNERYEGYVTQDDGEQVHVRLLNGNDVIIDHDSVVDHTSYEPR